MCLQLYEVSSKYLLQFQVIEWIQFCDGLMDGRKGKTICLPTLPGGGGGGGGGGGDSTPVTKQYIITCMLFLSCWAHSSRSED